MADNIINISLKSKSDPTVNITTVDSGTVTGSALIAPEIRFVATGGVGSVGATGADGTAVVGENGISQTNLATNSVGGDQILDDAIDTAQLKNDSVNSGVIQTNAVLSSHIATNAVTSDSIATNSVDATHIDDGVITNTLLEDETIESGKIKDSAIITSKIANNQIVTSKIADNTVTGAKIENNVNLDGTVVVNHLNLAGSSPALIEGPSSDSVNFKTHSLINFQNTSGVTIASLDQSGNLTISGTVDGIDIATTVAANTAKTSYDSVSSDKVDYISITQPVNLDAVEDGISINNAKVGITTSQSNAIISNTADVLTKADSNNSALTGLAKVTTTDNVGFRVENTWNGGDAGLGFRTSYGTDVNYTMGIKGSDDKFYISHSSAIGTNDLLSLSSSGYLELLGTGRFLNTTSDNVTIRLDNTWNGGDNFINFRTSYGTDKNVYLGIDDSGGTNDKGSFVVSKIESGGSPALSVNLDNDVVTLSQTASASITGNSGTATALESARNINGVSFDGTGDITITAAGTTLSDTVPVSKGGTGQTDLSNVSVGTAAALTSGDKTIDGDLQINGNDIKDNDGTTCITFDSAGDTTIANKLTVTDLEITDDLTLGDDVNINATGVLYLAGANNGEYITSSAVNTISIVAVSKILLDADTDVDGNLDADTVSADTVTLSSLSSKADQPITIKSDQSMNFTLDFDNDETGLKFIFNNGGSGGVTEIASIDDAGNFQCDGDIQVSGNDIKDDDGVSCITFDSSGNTTVANTLNASVTGNVTGNASGSSGSCTGNAATATTAQGIVGATDGDVTIKSDGNISFFIDLDGDETSQKFTFNNGTGNPNIEIASIDESGNFQCDGVITAKQRHIINCGWNGNSTPLSWLPFGYGGTGEAYYYSSNSGYLESGGIVAPCDGYVESVVIRCEEAAGSTEVGVHIAPAGTEVPADDDDSFISPAVDMAADDTGYKFSGFVDDSSNTNSFSAGDVIMISFNPTSACGDAVATAVLVLDWNNTL